MSELRCGDPSCTKWHPPSRLAQLSAHALHLAQHGEHGAATAVLNLIAKIYGTPGLMIACAIWVDRYLRAIPELRDADPDELDGLVFIAAGGDEVIPDANLVAPGQRWGGRFMLARARRDQDMQRALINSISDDDEAVVDAALSLLGSCVRGMAEPHHTVERWAR